MFFFKQKTAYEMRISDWSSDVCSSDPADGTGTDKAGSTKALPAELAVQGHGWGHGRGMGQFGSFGYATGLAGAPWSHTQILDHFYGGTTMGDIGNPLMMVRSEEHTSELQSLMRIAYAVFCLKKKQKKDSNKTDKKNHL